MAKPRIICHMQTTIDGKIVSGDWGSSDLVKKFSGLYEKAHESFDSQAWMVGRVTMEKDFTDGLQPELVEGGGPVKREPFIGDPDATSFAIAVDARGVLGWEENEISGDHIISVLTESVGDAYLHYLQRQGVSYIFAGKSEPDMRQALEQLVSLFPIETIMLEGGGGLNGTFLNEGLIDELSILLLPVADGTAGGTTVFEVGSRLAKNPASLLSLTSVEKLDQGVLWLKYAINE